MQKTKFGFGLIEVLISIIVLSLGLSTLMMLYFTAMSQQSKPIQSLQAQYLAQTYLDRALISSSWRQGSVKFGPVNVPELKQFNISMTVLPAQEIASIMMQNVSISVYWKTVLLASVDTWVAL